MYYGNPSCAICRPTTAAAATGHVSDVHFTPIWAMMLTVEKESIIIRMPALCPHCHSDQVVKRGKTKVQI